MPTDTSKKQGRKRKYRHDGTPVWSKRTIDGPGIWVSCVKGKEKQTIGELYDLLDSLATDIWPEDSDDSDDDAAPVLPPQATDGEQQFSSTGEGLSIEDQLAREIATMKKPRREHQRFANCITNTPCVVFIGCRAPVDPVQLVQAHVHQVEKSGTSRSRYTQRMVPSSETCVANLPEVVAMCRRLIVPHFTQEREGEKTYRIELRIRNHTTFARPQIIDEIAKCIPDTYKVDLGNPALFILVEVFKSVCGMSIVDDYYQYQKYNVMALAKSQDESRELPSGRVNQKKTEEMGAEKPSIQAES